VQENINIFKLAMSLSALERKAISLLKKVVSKKELQGINILFLGRKSKLSKILNNIKKFPNSEKPKIGKIVNETRNFIQKLIEECNIKINKKSYIKSLAHNIDVTLPGRNTLFGNKHPLTIISENILHSLNLLGFSLFEGPEVEHDYYNFEALNIPKNHPSRDMQDTFYVDSDLILRTHTSSVQIRAMLNIKSLPMKIVSVGKVYRRDQDVSHSPMFHQVEGFYIGKNVNFSELKYTLYKFIQHIFSINVSLRIRGSYFPFTEPSVEVDISCICKSKDSSNCRLCKGNGWIEIMGAGMIHPNVLNTTGIDSNKYAGFAFGIGIERVALLKYSISDIRLFFENDVRFLAQF
jgi:phenylalanyl-tRNA synthetase alpha chain